MADNALTKLSLNGQIGASIGAALLVGGLFYYFYYADAVQEREDKTVRLEALQTEIRGLEVTANRLQEFQREVQLLEAKLETLKRILPPAKETPDLMRKVQALAAQSNLQIKVFTPMAVVSRDFYQEWPINVGVQGTYHNLALFFDRIGRLSRLVNVGELKIAAMSAQSVSGTITATCIATTFVYIDTPPPAPGAAGAPRPR